MSATTSSEILLFCRCGERSLLHLGSRGDAGLTKAVFLGQTLAGCRPKARLRVDGANDFSHTREPCTLAWNLFLHMVKEHAASSQICISVGSLAHATTPGFFRLVNVLRQNVRSEDPLMLERHFQISSRGLR